MRRFLASALVLLPLTFGLSVGLAFTGPAANAYATAPSPVTIGRTALKSVPGRMLTTVGKMTPWGRAISIGMLAYSTKDAWWPIVSGGGYTGSEGGNDPGTGATGCVISAQAAVLGQGVQVMASWSGCSGAGNTGLRVNQVSGACITAATGAVTTFGAFTYTGFGFGTASGSATLTGMNPCGTGQTVLTWTGNVVMSSAPAKGTSNTFTFRAPWSDGNTVQTTEVTCRKPDGTLVTISDTLTGQPDRVAIPSCADRVPGSIPWAWKVKAGPAAGAQTIQTEVTTKPDVFDEYADCFGPSGLQCEIRVWVDDLPCTLDREAACGAWKRLLDDPLTAPRVKCKFGTHIIDADDCASLSYKAAVKPRPITKDDIQTGGEVNTDPEYAPPPAPQETIPGTGTNPGTSPAPGSSTDTSSSGCWGAAWSWNPVDWVVVPVKCSLMWAFKPPPGYLNTTMTSLRDSYNNTTPAKYVNAVTGLVPGSVSGCGGITADLPLPGVDVDSMHLGAACTGFMADAAGVVRVVISAMVVIGGGWACVRALGAGFGWRPGVGGEGA